MLRFDIITLFPKMFDSPFAESIILHAKKKGIIEINTHQLRDYASDKHKTVDDTPCGGGPGMVIKVDVVDRAISKIKYQRSKIRNSRVILLTPSGERFTQKKAIELSQYDNIVLLCGHYEGFDQRVHDHLVDEEISIGDYVLTGGEIPAMVLVDTITRMIPGVLKEESILNESFMDQDIRYKIHDYRQARQNTNKSKISNKNSTIQQCNNNFFDYPVYTRPIEYKGWRVPEVLLCGDHKKIMEWRKQAS